MNVICHIKDQMHREYLNYLFTTEDGAFKITRDTEMGRFICAMVRPSEYPVHQKTDHDKAITFTLPKTSEQTELFTRFSYISPTDQSKINDFLIAKFNLDFIQYYFAGRNLNLMQKEVINSFIVSRKLVSRIGEIEQLKKRVYRSEERDMKKMANRLARRVQLQNAVITKTILEYQSTQPQWK